MTDVIKKLLDKFISKEYRLVIREANVLETLSVINKHSSWFIDKKLHVDRYDWDNGCAEWYIKFKASYNQWSSIVDELHDKNFKLTIEDTPKYIFVIK